MSNSDDLERALDSAQSASKSAKKAAVKSPNSFLKFLRELGLRTLANSLATWIKDNWHSVVDWIMAVLGV